MKWLWRRLRRDRRWISDQAERDAHDNTTRDRLPRQPTPDDRGREGGLADLGPRDGT